MPVWPAIKQCRPMRDVVRDLHQIVDLGALADDGVAGRAAIDRGVGADLDVVLNDDSPGLRNFLVAARRRQIAEAVLADARAGMDDHAVADQRVEHRGAGADRAVASDSDAGTDHRAGRDERARPDFGAGPDHRQRIDDHARLDPRRSDARAHRPSGRSSRTAMMAAAP